MNLLPRLFGLTKEQIQELYRDVDLGSTIDNDSNIKSSVNSGINISKISVQSKKTPKFDIITFTRGKWSNKQKITFKVLTNHVEYLQGLLELELTFKTFLDTFEREERIYSDVGFEVYRSTFQTRALDTLPENMYHIHSIFTKNVSMWLRFKRLFAIIDVFIDPLVISTLKFKMFQYLQHQRRTIISINEVNNHSLITTLPDSEVHKLLDLFVFLPYGYLFFLFKHLNMTNGMQLSLLEDQLE